VEDFKLVVYTYSDFNGNKENGVPTLGYLMRLGSTTISCRSCKQFVPTYSTIKVEYAVATKETKEIVWLGKILEYL
jgi:hypothetical protein